MVSGFRFSFLFISIHPSNLPFYFFFYIFNLSLMQCCIYVDRSSREYVYEYVIFRHLDIENDTHVIQLA